MKLRRLTLRQARKRARLTQVKLSARSGVGQTYISKLELGTVTKPAADVVFALADALQLDPRALRFGHPSDESVTS